MLLQGFSAVALLIYRICRVRQHVLARPRMQVVTTVQDRAQHQEIHALLGPSNVDTESRVCGLVCAALL
jgi:hypothetical protein